MSEELPTTIAAKSLDAQLARPTTGRFYLDANGNYTWDSGFDLVTVPFGVSSVIPVTGRW